MRAYLVLTLVQAVVFGVVLGACASNKIPVAPDPFRPEAKQAPPDENTKVEPTPTARTADCEPMAPNQGGPVIPWSQRKETAEQADAEARAARSQLMQAEKSMGTPEFAEHLTRSVSGFHRALSLNPYDPIAIYNLAAAYALIDRDQCAFNLLYRLKALEKWPSQKKSVKERFDSLYGRGKMKSRGPDSDFDSEFRADPRFGALKK